MPTKSKQKQMSPIIGAIIITALYILTVLIICIVRYGSDNSTSNTALYSMVALMISGGVGTFISAKLTGAESPVRSMIPSGIILVLFTAISLAVCGGKVGLSHAMNMLCFMLISALCAFLAKPRAAKRGQRKVRR